MTRWFKNSAPLVAALMLVACSAVQPQSLQQVSQPNSKNMTNGQQKTGQQNTAWDNAYGGADKSFDTELLRLREVVAPKFQTFTFKDDKTGVTMAYDLFIPKAYDPHKSYPLVLFMADASTVGKGVAAPLKQGYGGIIWATDDSQAAHPSFVLVPSFKGPGNTTGMNSAVNDNWQTTPEVDTALNLLHHVVGQYNIDTHRLYTTGQSMGGMISFYLNATHPDLFAASIFVGSQWDIKALSPLAQQKFLYIVSAGDAKASGGMREVGDMLKSKGVDFATTTFAANLPVATQDQSVQQLLQQNKPINFIQFTAGTVAPASFMNSGGAGEHMYSFDHAYVLPSVRNWLFQQHK